jgi:hypothetical protein
MIKTIQTLIIVTERNVSLHPGIWCLLLHVAADKGLHPTTKSLAYVAPKSFLPPNLSTSCEL